MSAMEEVQVVIDDEFDLGFPAGQAFEL